MATVRKFCHACGSQIRKSAVICMKCGVRQSVVSEPPTPPPVPKSPSNKYCHACGNEIDARAEICPKCGIRQPHETNPQIQPAYKARTSVSSVARSDANGKKIACGIFAILLGPLGVHKFLLGYTGAGLVMLLGSILTLGIGAFVMWIIALIEGIIYLCKSDDEFYRIYMVGQQQWF